MTYRCLTFIHSKLLGLILFYNAVGFMTPQFHVSSTLLLCRGLVSSVVNEVRYRTLHALRQDLLDLLGDNRILAVVQRVCLGGGLAGGTAGRVNLQYRLAINDPSVWRYESLPYLEEPPQDLLVRRPAHSWGLLTRQLRETCPGRARLRTSSWSGR
jgi:hypothetical protein